MEIWKDISGYEGKYQVSSLGRVKTIKKNVIHKSNCDSRGYPIAILYKSNKRKCFKIHRLVFSAFNGVLIEGLVIDHINNDQKDNRTENLQQVTQRANSQKNPSTSNKTSRFSGVSWDHKNKKWISQITKKGKYYFLGRFDCELRASVTYNKKAILLDDTDRSSGY